MSARRMEDTLERIRESHRAFCSHMQAPAPDAAIERLQRESARRFGLRVPERYCHLLRLADGVEWNSARFYGTQSLAYVDHPERVLPGVLEKTDEWWPRRHKLVLGAIEDQCFFYDANLSEYQAYIVGDGEPYRRFKEFDALFDYALEGRWPEGA